MRNVFVDSIVLLMALITFPSGLQAQTPTGPGAAKTIPGLSGIWEAPDELNPIYAKDQRSDLCGEGACTQALKLRPLRLIITVEEPQMLPWAEEIFKATRQKGNQNPNAPGREDANPWFSACLPISPSALMLNPFVPVEVRQFPDVALLFFTGTAGGDHEVRRIYVDGRGHPSDLQPTWMGHSIGKYEGDTLVVDTIGIKGNNRWLDPQGHPQSDALHLVERIRRVDQKSLEYEVTIEDSKAYKNTWGKKLVRELAIPGPRNWDAAECEELLQMGTHYSAESKK